MSLYSEQELVFRNTLCDILNDIEEENDKSIRTLFSNKVQKEYSNNNRSLKLEKLNLDNKAKETLQSFLIKYRGYSIYYKDKFKSINS